MPAAVYSWPSSLQTPAEFDLWSEWPVETSTNNDSELGLEEIIGGYSRLHAVVTWSVTTIAESLAIEAFLGRLRGHLNAAVVPNLKYTERIGTASGAWTVNGVHQSDAEQVTLAGGSGTFAPGDWLEIEETFGTPRAYLITSFATNIAEIAPALHERVSAGRAIKHLGDGSTTVIHDTMQLVSKTGPATAFPAAGYALINARTVEFVSFRSATVVIPVTETVTNLGATVTNSGVAVVVTF